MKRLKDFFHFSDEKNDPEDDNHSESLSNSVLPEHQRDKLERDMQVLDDTFGLREKKVQREAEKQVQIAAEDSLKKLHLIQMGRCPNCGEHLRQHLFATVCENCDFHTYEMPRRGPVKIHLKSGGEPVAGECCYVLKNGDVLVMREDVVIAKIPRPSMSWIEYVWSETEIDQRYKQLIDRMNLVCGWCTGPADPDKDGFHLAQIAFGSNQERYVFCSDDCYEAFRKMYPARVHRNCYERNCADCTLCTKRYDDENDGVHLIAKDFLKIKKLVKDTKS